MTTLVTSDKNDNNEIDLEGLVSRHQELKTEINTMEKNFENFNTSAQDLFAYNHYAADVIEERLEELRAGWDALLKSWENRAEEFQRRKKAENMNREVTQLEAWLLNQEAELSLSEVGNCLDNVEELLKKHDEMERMLLAQEERFLDLIHASDDSQDFHDHTDKTGSTQSSDNTLGCDIANNPNQNIEASSSDYVEELINNSMISEDFSANTNDNFIPTDEPSELNRSQSHQYENTPDKSPTSYDSVKTMQLSELNSIPNFPDLNVSQGNGETRSEQLPKHTLTANDKMVDTSDESENLTEDASLVIDKTPVGFENGIIQNDREIFLNTDNSEFEMKADGERLDNEPCNKSSFYKEPMPASQRILGVAPLCSGLLQRKQETDTSGQRSVAQPWRSYYTVLSEDILQFFNDYEGFRSKWHVSKPKSLVGALCERVKEGTREGYIFRVVFRDKSEYLFEAESEEECKLWVVKIDSVIKMAASDADNDAYVFYGTNTASHGDRAGGDYTGDNVKDSDGNFDGVAHNNSDELSHESENYDEVSSRESDGGVKDDTDILGSDDILNPYNKNLTSNNLQEPHPSQNNSDTPVIVITDPNSNNEFVMEDEIFSDTYPSDEDIPLTIEDIQLSDEDTISLPDHSDYKQPSWYPETDVVEPNDSHSDPVFSGQCPPPIPSFPPPSIPLPDVDLPPDIPEALPPPDDDLLDMLDSIPPPVLDPSFDFLVERRDQVS